MSREPAVSGELPAGETVNKVWPPQEEKPPQAPEPVNPVRELARGIGPSARIGPSDPVASRVRSSISNGASRGAFSSGVNTGAALRVIPVRLGDHLPSRHVLRLRRVHPPVRLKPQTPSFEDVARPLKWRYWIEEISGLSLIGLVFLIGLNTAKYVFRVELAAPVRGALRPRAVPVGGTEWRPKSSAGVSSYQKIAQPALALPTAFARAEPEAASSILMKRVLFKDSFRELAFVALSALVILMPLRLTVEAMRLRAVRAEVVAEAASGLASFMAGSQAVVDYDFFKAGSEFEAAVSRFQEAETSLNKIPVLLRALASVLPSGQQLTSGERLLEAGAALSRVGQTISSNFLFLKENTENSNTIPADKLLTRLSAAAASVKPDISEAESALAAVRLEDLPREYRTALEQVRLLLPIVHSGIDQLLALNEIAPDLLGLEGRRRYLIMFQNNHELRASGGFMGSFAILDVDDGRVQSLKVPAGGTYDMQGSLVPRLLAPEPLQLINPRWEFQDANWWSDWPTSAKKVSWFYRQAGGESVDAVVAMDVNVIESLLKITGPIPMPAYNLTITADNFAAEAQAEVELRYDKAANRPKQFIADLAPLLIGRLEAGLNTDGLKIAAAVSQALTEKHLLIYSSEADTEANLRDLGWAGAIDTLPPFTDSIGIVHTNIAGGKTDNVITDQVEHNVAVQEDGALVDTLTITRSHHGSKGEQFSGVRNVDYLRVYVPEGSQLLSAEGFQAPDSSLFKIPSADLEMDNDLRPMFFESRRDSASGVVSYDELGRTVFAHWLMVDPGESAAVKLSYRLPWRLQESAAALWQPWSSYFGWTQDSRIYRLRWEKQPGTKAASFHHTFKSFQPIEVTASSREVEAGDYGWSWESILESDAVLGVTFRIK